MQICTLVVRFYLWKRSKARQLASRGHDPAGGSDSDDSCHERYRAADADQRWSDLHQSPGAAPGWGTQATQRIKDMDWVILYERLRSPFRIEGSFLQHCVNLLEDSGGTVESMYGEEGARILWVRPAHPDTLSGCRAPRWDTLFDKRGARVRTQAEVQSELEDIDQYGNFWPAKEMKGKVVEPSGGDGHGEASFSTPQQPAVPGIAVLPPSAAIVFPSTYVNGLLVDGTVQGGADILAFVSDAQVMEALQVHGVQPHDAAHNMSAMAEKVELGRPFYHREILADLGLRGTSATSAPRGAKHIHSLCGDLHWRGMLCCHKSTTIYLWDPYGQWPQRGDAATLHAHLKRRGEEDGFDVVVLDIRLQDDGFQCGVWWLFMASFFCHCYMDTPGVSDFNVFCSETRLQDYARQLTDQPTLSLVVGDRTNGNAAAAQALRLFFRARVTNPRLCGTPLGKPTAAAGPGPSPAAQHIGSHVPSAPHTTHAG